MALGPERIQSAVKDGYAFPCAMCEHLHWGLDRGLKRCKAAVDDKVCGGPLTGLGFPEYQGVMTRDAIARHCFKCGDRANKIVEGNKGPGLVGVCNRHLPILSRVMETTAKLSDEPKYEIKP